MFVFIDESGDPGFKLTKGSTEVFVAAMVAFESDEAIAAAKNAIDSAATRLGILSEFRFNKSRHEVRDAFFKAVAKCAFRVRAIVVKKALIYSPHLRSDKEAFYSFFVRSMLSFDGGLLREATVIIDGSGDRDFKRELKTYLRKRLQRRALKDVKFSNSRNDRLVQLADMCAGAIARSYKADRDFAGRWREMLQPKTDDVWEFR